MEKTLFYIGLHHPNHAGQFPRACISINVLRGRKKPIQCGDVLVDSAAFTELATHGSYRHPPSVYAAELRRLHIEGVVKITAAVAQDYMCEPFMLEKTGMTVEQHQQLTIERYDALLAEDLPFSILPVLQGYSPYDYVKHISMYGLRLSLGAWVGVGSVCKRNGNPETVLSVLSAIKNVRPDLRLHGFGVKTTSLAHPGIRKMLYSSDSMAWSYAARIEGRDGNLLQEALNFAEKIQHKIDLPPAYWQPQLPF